VLHDFGMLLEFVGTEGVEAAGKNNLIALKHIPEGGGTNDATVFERASLRASRLLGLGRRLALPVTETPRSARRWPGPTSAPLRRAGGC
jgi:hypothetical protein